ncbi:PLC-like phosphodiesterase, partial [Aureobasidium sp. EXF-8845]
LLRRFTTFQHQQFSTGIDLSRWPDNPPLPFTVRTPVGVHLTIQDHYSPTTSESLPNLVAKKGGDVASMLMRASRDTEPWHWYINFSSAFEFNIYYQIPPKDIAVGGYSVFRWVEGINLRLCNFLKARLADVDEPQRFGVVVMDFVEKPASDLVKTVIEANFVVPMKRRGGMAGKRMETAVLGLVMVLVLGAWALFEWQHIGRFNQSRGDWCPKFMHACSLGPPCEAIA